MPEYFFCVGVTFLFYRSPTLWILGSRAVPSTGLTCPLADCITCRIIIHRSLLSAEVKDKKDNQNDALLFTTSGRILRLNRFAHEPIGNPVLARRAPLHFAECGKSPATGPLIKVGLGHSRMKDPFDSVLHADGWWNSSVRRIPVKND